MGRLECRSVLGKNVLDQLRHRFCLEDLGGGTEKIRNGSRARKAVPRLAFCSSASSGRWSPSRRLGVPCCMQITAGGSRTAGAGR